MGKNPHLNTHAAGVSRILIQEGFTPYRFQGTHPGFIARNYDRQGTVRLVRISLKALDRAKEPQDEYRKATLSNITEALRHRGFQVRFGWTDDGKLDPTRLVVAKLPFTAPYDAKPPLVVVKPQELSKDATLDDVRGQVHKILGARYMASVGQAPGFNLLDDQDGRRVVYVTYRESSVTPDEQHAAEAFQGRQKVHSYHRLLRTELPTAFLLQSGDPFGTVLAGATWEELYGVLEALGAHQWEMEVADAEAAVAKAVMRNPEAVEQEDEYGADHVLTDFDLLRDIFASKDTIEAAVREITSEHTNAHDAAAASLEARLYHQVLLAIAAGAPEAVELARLALTTQHLYFLRS